MIVLFYCWAHKPNEGVGRCNMQHQTSTSNIKIGVGIDKLTCLWTSSRMLALITACKSVSEATRRCQHQDHVEDLMYIILKYLHTCVYQITFTY